jgi:hypothetical protein
MSTNQSLNPKLKIVAIYNKRRIDQGLSPINVADYSFSNPIQYAGVKSTKNTRIYLTPNTSSSQFGRITIYYDRIDLSSVIGARVIKHDATTIVELLPSINEELGVELTALDIVDGQLTDNLNFVLRASANSLVFTGSTSIGYYVDDTALFPAEGTILEAGQCNTVSFYKYNLVADGIGGAREDILEYNSVDCGFSLPTPAITVRADNSDIVLPITSQNNILTLVASMSSLHTYIGYELSWLVKYPGSTVFEKFYSEQFFASSETKERVKYLELNTNIPLAVSSIVVRATLTVINNTSINSSVDKVINLHITPPTTTTSNPTSPPSTTASGTTKISTTTTAAPTTTTTTNISTTTTTSTPTTTLTPTTSITSSVTTTPTTTPPPTSTSSVTTTTTTTPSTTPTPSQVSDPTLVSTLANTRTLSLTEASTITALTTGKTLVESYNTNKLNFSVTLSNPSILDPAGVNYIVKVILKSDAVVISNTGVKTTIEPGILHTEGIVLVPSSNSKTINFDIGTENAVVGASTAGKALLSYSPVTYLLFGEGIHFVTDFSITTEVYQSSTLVGTTTKTYVLEYLRDKNLTTLTTQFNFDNTETLTTNTFVKTNAVVEIPIHLSDRPVSTIKTNAMVQNAVSINTANSTSFYKLLKSLVTFTNFTNFKNEIFNLRIYRTDETNNITGPSSVMIQEYFYTGGDLFTAEETPREKIWNVIYDPEVEAGSTHPTYYHLVFTGSLGRKKVTTYVQTLIAQWYVDLRNAFQFPKVSTSLNGATAYVQQTLQLPITDQNKNVKVDFTFTNLVVGYSYKYKLIQFREDIVSAGSSNFPDEYYKLLLEGTITATASSMPLTRYFAIDPTYIVDSTKNLACNVVLSTYSIADTYGSNAFSPKLLTTGTNYINISLNTMTPSNNVITTSNKTRSFDLQMFFIDAQGNVLGLPPDLADNYQIELWSKITDPTNVDSRIWHRDQEDRIIESIDETDWGFQLDNELPRKIEGQIFIPRGIYHRLIKGTGDLKIKLKKLI